MAATIDDFKVFNAVIVLDSISVVNVFVWSEIAPEMLCHNVAMLKNILAASCDANVSVVLNSPCFDSIIDPAAFHTTKSSCPSVGNSFGLDVKIVSAVFAFNCRHNSYSISVLSSPNLSKSERL